MYQPYPSSGQPAGPVRPPAPAPVLTAVKLMYAGAAVSTVEPDHRGWPSSSATQAPSRASSSWAPPHRGPGQPLAPAHHHVGVVFGLVEIALWLWMARANGQGRNWARIVSTVLFGLATLQLRGAAGSR